MVKSKITLFGVVTFLVALLLIANVSAITASIGNSRMILRPEINEEIERSILVKNVNDVPVDISMFPSGDLEKNVKIFGENFTLPAGDEKKVTFTIFTEKAGSFDTKVNVRFTGPDGNGIGLSAAIILITNGTSQDDNPDDEIDDSDDSDANDDNDDTDDNDDNDDTVTFNATSQTSQTNNSNINTPIRITGDLVKKTANSLSISPALFLLISTTFLLLVFLLLIIYVRKINFSKGARRKSAI
jgi:hypothetical protein